MRSIRVFIAAFLLFFIPFNLYAGNNDLFLKASNLTAVGEFDKAISLLMEVQHPENGGDKTDFIKSRIQVAKLAHALKNYGDAKKVCDEVLKLDPENMEANDFLISIKRETTPKYILFFTDSLKFFPSLVKGALMTLLLVVSTMIISPFGGLFIAIGRISSFKPFSGAAWFIIWFFRGTPLLLQLFFIYYGLPAMGITLSPLTAALIGLGVNYSAYLAEIIRAGIESIESGQMEAAKALGMTYSQAMKRVIIPQTYKRLIPPIGNEFIALIKDTALVSTISMVELMRSADRLFNTYFNINVLILAAVIYLLFTTFFTFIFENLERRVGVYEKK